jgi:DNA-binding GntR family transcriptional regulator
MPTSSSRKRDSRVSRRPAGKAEHGTSVTTAFHRIRELIILGKLSPGTWIVESDLCLHLNMSRTPVRGALYLLQREGYVQELRNTSKSRMIVSSLTKEDANELYPIIGRLEGLAGRRAAELPYPQLRELADKLKQINARLIRIAKQRTLEGSSIFDLDREFHRLIVNAGAGPRLMTLHRAIEPQTERYWRLYASAIINNLTASTEEHDAIMTALIARDADRLEDALKLNWENGCKRLAHVIDVFGERGSWQNRLDL